jgi:surface polysaccharide O-acyltransferase-like enzyme
VNRRTSSIETFRVLAIFGVILCHSNTLGRLAKLGGGSIFVDVIVYLVWWVSLPFFFISAGYFFAESVRTYGEPVARLQRYVNSLVWIFLTWTCIYIMVPKNWPSAVHHNGLWQPFYSETLKNVNLLVMQHVRLFLTGEDPIWHLWFLPALMFSLAVLAMLAVFRQKQNLMPLIVTLYMLALAEEIAGRHLFGATFEVGLWSIALLFTGLGWWIAGRKTSSVRTALCLIVGGYALAVLEGALMNSVLHLEPLEIQRHYFLGGVILSLGIFLLALAKPDLGQSTFLPYLAQFTLGVYVSHVLVLYTLAPIGNWLLNSPWLGMVLLFPVIVYVFSVLLTVVLLRVPIVKYLVSKAPAFIKPTIKSQPCSSGSTAVR